MINLQTEKNSFFCQYVERDKNIYKTFLMEPLKIDLFLFFENQCTASGKISPFGVI